jgi:hypothetical protein
MGLAPYTPRVKYPGIVEPQTSSTTTKRASTSSYESTDITTEDTPLKKKHKTSHATDISHREPANLSDVSTKQKPYVQVPKPKTPKPKRVIARTPTRGTHRPASPSKSKSEPRQTMLIRRVQTVVEMPVKEEDDDEGPAELLTRSISPSGSKSVTASRKQSTRLRPRKLNRRIVEDGDSDAEDDSDDDRAGDGDDDDDELRMRVHVSLFWMTVELLPELFGLRRSTAKRYTATFNASQVPRKLLAAPTAPTVLVS